MQVPFNEVPINDSGLFSVELLNVALTLWFGVRPFAVMLIVTPAP
jgi:hypothetical protein